MDRPTILVANAGKDLLSRLRVLMSSPDMKMLGIDSEIDVVSLLQEKPPNLVIACSNGGDARKGLELIRQVRQLSKSTPVIFITGQSSERLAIEALRAGADDYFKFPFSDDSLQTSLKRLLCGTEASSTATSSSQVAQAIVGDSRSMNEVKGYIIRVAATDSTVLITGETGTGKELAAEMIHLNSRRKKKPLIRVNCSALPEPLLESELFGHKRGAFTDAKTDRKGLFQEAEKGTLFLDEIGELPMMLQPKLLRAIEERCIRAVGSDAEIAVDARILAATNIDLESAVEAGKFREDLFYRLNVMQMAAPPLRSRGADILALAWHFIQRFADRVDKRVTGLSENAAQKLLDYAWPGNVRELRNAMERAVALTRFEKIAVDDLPPKIQAYSTDHFFIGGHDPHEFLPMEEVERRYILHVLKAVEGNRTTAARILKLDRKTLYRKLQRYGIQDV